jgi:hypothetical protein
LELMKIGRVDSGPKRKSATSSPFCGRATARIAPQRKPAPLGFLLRESMRAACVADHF